MKSKHVFGGRINIAACLFCLVLGGGAGSLLSSRKAPATGSGTGLSASHGRAGTPALSVGGNGRKTGWESRPVRKDAGQSKLSEDVMIAVPTSLLSSIGRKSVVRHLNQPILDDADPVDTALGLTEIERDQIVQAWRAIRDELRRVEVASMHTEDLNDGSVRLSLPDLSVQGKGLAAQFRKTMSSSLGPERGLAFCAIKQIDGLLSNGFGPRSVDILVESVGGRPSNYRMTLDDGARKRVWVGANIPDEIRHLTDAAGVFPTVAEAVAARTPGSVESP